MPDSAHFHLAADSRLAEALAAYVPPLVLDDLRRDFGPGAAARETIFPGAVLLTDIAGFSTLTARVDAAGRTGVEQLSRALDAYFTDLIALIETHGGQVLKFAGDALVAVWKGTADSLAETAQRAAQCALEIQRQMPERTPAEGADLSMRVSLGTGAVRHSVLGGVGLRWVSRLSGPALADALAAIPHAEPGDVVLAPPMARLLAGAVQTSGLSGGGARLHSAAPVAICPAMPRWVLPRDAAALFSHVPAAVRERLVAGHDGWLAEFRRVSVLFIHVPGVDHDAARSLEREQAVVCAIQAVIGRFCGTVDDLGDDRAGLTLVAAFGLPDWTHEDNAVRAVRAALAIRGELRGLGFSPAIGVTTGRLFCGAIGSPRRRSYSMVGDAMNRCARLMMRAENDVLCDQATRRAAERAVRFEFLRAEELKGMASAVAIHRPVAEYAAPPAGARGMVGRASERAALRARLAGLHERGAGGVVLIEGEAGIGKSTLVAELRGLAAETGLRVLSGGGDSLERASSHRVWRGVFGDVLGFSPDADEGERASLLELFLADRPEIAPRAPLLGPALGLDIAENDVTREMTGYARGEATTALLLHLLSGVAAAEPLVVVLEDTHWADSNSLALALEMHRRVPRILLVLASRPLDGPLAEEWSALRQAAGGDRIALGPLPAPDIPALVCLRLGLKALADPLARFISERSEGHPFYSEEIAYSLRDAGLLVCRDGRGELAPAVRDLHGLDFPDTVQGVVSARLDRLLPREQLAIKLASVSGRTFSRRTLLAVHPVAGDREHLPASLDRFVALGFTVRAGAEEDGVFAFKHAIIQEVAYSQLTGGHRQQLHLRLAEFTEQHDAANSAMLAYHWRNTATPLRAIGHLERAGAQALLRYANREAIGFLTQAIELTNNGADRPPALAFGRWHRQIGEAHHHLGDLGESRRWLEKGRRIHGYAVPSRRKMLWLALPFEIARQVWHRIARYGDSARGAVPQVLLGEAVEAANQLGEIAFFTNDLPTSVFHIIQGLNLAEVRGPSPKLAEMYAAMMIVAGAIPPAILGDTYFRLGEKALALAERAVNRAYVELLMGIFFNGRGRLAESAQRLAPALATFREYGHGRRAEECLTNIFYLLLFRGKFPEAGEVVEDLKASTAQRGDDQRLGWALALEAHLTLPTGGPAATLKILGPAAGDHWDALTRNSFHASSAIAHFRLGETDRAREHAQLALDRLASAPPVSYTAMLDCSNVAEVFLGLSAAAPDLAGQARRAVRTLRLFALSFPIGRPRAHLWTGLERWQRGRAAAAAANWRKGLAAAGRLAMPHDRALLHGHLALVHGASERARAAELFTQLGAHAELACWRGTGE